MVWASCYCRHHTRPIGTIAGKRIKRLLLSFSLQRRFLTLHSPDDIFCIFLRKRKNCALSSRRIAYSYNGFCELVHTPTQLSGYTSRLVELELNIQYFIAGTEQERLSLAYPCILIRQWHALYYPTHSDRRRCRDATKQSFSAQRTGKQAPSHTEASKRHQKLLCKMQQTCNILLEVTNLEPWNLTYCSLIAIVV